MKKLDYLIILVVILFIGIIYLSIYKPYFNNINENKILIIFDNQIIDEINISEERTYIIKTNNNNIDIYIDDVLTKTIPSNNKNIYNKIVIKNNNVIMQESNCKGKDCMYMETNKISKLPIICTNGVVIKFSTNNKYTSDIII